VLLHITAQTKKAEDGLRKGEENMPDAPRLIRLLDPTAKARQDTTPLAPRPPDLRGKRIGILDNTKSNADVLMLRLAALLCQQHGAAEIVHRRKAHAAIGATDELCEDIVLGCDVVLVGSGD
jgi:hypothetical protein